MSTDLGRSYGFLQKAIRESLVRLLSKTLSSLHSWCLLRTALALVQERFGSDGDFLLRLGGVLLDRENPDAIEDAQILQLLSSERARTSIVSPEQKTEAFRLLWNQGVHHFHRKSYKAAGSYFESCYSYGTHKQLVKTARSMALCLVGVKDYSRSDACPLLEDIFLRQGP